MVQLGIDMGVDVDVDVNRRITVCCAVLSERE